MGRRKSDKAWTKKDDDLIKVMLSHCCTTQQIADALGRTKGAVSFRISDKKLIPGKRIYSVYLDDDELIAVGTSEEIASQLNVGRKTIYAWMANKGTGIKAYHVGYDNDDLEQEDED